MVAFVTQVLIIVVGIVQLIVALGFAVFAIYKGIDLLDRLTTGVEELKNGNITISLMLSGIFIGISIILQAGVSGLVHGFAAL